MNAVAAVRPVRVLHVVASLDQRYGGPLRVILDLSARSAALGIDTEMLGFGALNIPDNPFPSERIHSLDLAFPQGYCYSPGLRPWLRENLHRFDGVVTHGMWMYPNWAVARECQALNKPYACFPHGMLEPWAVYHQGVLKAAKKIAYWVLRESAVSRKARCFLFTTRTEQELAVRMSSLKTETAIVAPFGIEAATPALVEPSRRELIQPADQRVALFLGRVHPKKNVTFLVEAWAAAQLPPEWKLVIAGSGEPAYIQEVEALIRRHGLEERVQMTGFVSGNDRTYLLQRAEWFLLPSSQENFGVAVLEAIEHGCPVAISDRVYLAESFGPESEVMPVKLETWVEFLRNRMPDRARRDRVLRLDRERLLQQFEINQVARHWAGIWQRLFQNQN